MIVVDSSGWIEYFTDGPLADEYAARLRNLSAVIVPVIVLYEVYKRLKRELTEDEALVAVSAIQRARIVPVSTEIALSAADISLEERLPMADALILATARLHRAELVTSDVDFESVGGVTYLPKPKSRQPSGADN